MPNIVVSEAAKLVSFRNIHQREMSARAAEATSSRTETT